MGKRKANITLRYAARKACPHHRNVRQGDKMKIREVGTLLVVALYIFIGIAGYFGAEEKKELRSDLEQCQTETNN